MTKPDSKWHKGPPPHVGWWNASRSENGSTWRWWDGKEWSAYGNDQMTPQEAGAKADEKAYETDDPDNQIKWHWRYPKNAVVPRAAPKGPKLKIVVNNTRKKSSKAKSKKVA